MSFVHFRYIPLFLIVATLLVAATHGVPFINPRNKNTIQSRNFLQFGYSIWGSIGNPFGYNSYGCWCGTGNRGNLVVDATDRCCQVHDKCWESLEKNIAKCSPFTQWYSYNRKSDINIQCNNPVGTCEYGTCICDKAAVECFARHRSTSYDPDFDNWEGICTETSKAPKDDSERCPPVWNSREKYSSGTLVSVNGVIYKSLYSVGPGQNPKHNLVHSEYAGVTATWKKLSSCRRTSDASKF